MMGLHGCGKAERLVEDAGNRYPMPAISPDGRYLAFETTPTQSDPGRRRIMVARLEDGPPVKTLEFAGPFPRPLYERRRDAERFPLALETVGCYGSMLI